MCILELVAKFFVVCIILAIWFAWIWNLFELMGKKPWNESKKFAELEKTSRVAAKIAIGLTYLVVGLIGTLAAAIALMFVLNF